MINIKENKIVSETAKLIDTTGDTIVEELSFGEKFKADKILKADKIVIPNNNDIFRKGSIDTPSDTNIYYYATPILSNTHIFNNQAVLTIKPKYNYIPFQSLSIKDNITEIEQVFSATSYNILNFKYLGYIGRTYTIKYFSNFLNNGLFQSWDYTTPTILTSTLTIESPINGDRLNQKSGYVLDGSNSRFYMYFKESYSSFNMLTNNIDAAQFFLVGGGGSGGPAMSGNYTVGNGGGGGYTTTTPFLSRPLNNYLKINVGDSDQGTIIQVGNNYYTATQGREGNPNGNGNGGSGGGGMPPNASNVTQGYGGSDGSNGFTIGYGAGIGQGTTTREFQEAGQKLYSGGGGSGARQHSVPCLGGIGGGGHGATRTDWNYGNGYNAEDGYKNTGGGGGGGSVAYSGQYYYAFRGQGGSGIVVMRWTVPTP